MSKPILSAQDLTVYYPLRHRGFLRAVDGVSLDLYPGEVLGLVGESGCGKSSLGRALIRLHDPSSGSLSALGTDFLSLKGRKLREFRRNIQMVFQDPYASLNPRMTIFDALSEPLRAHFRLTTQEVSKKVAKALEQVGLTEQARDKYPHEFSGGQRQRIAIARALVLDPKVLIADEPVSSLDVSVQAQVLNLLKEIQKSTGLSMLFISHNLSVVKYISDRIAVMYLGKIVETANREDLFEKPLHPYTQALISAVPIPDPKLERERKRIPLTGELPSAENPPLGCAFHTRCPWVVPRCLEERPKLQAVASGNQEVACFEAGKKEN
ncbi:MAG: ATP-binding cassette domain-containing protein [Proteobacteria bacterium]|nr:ATP-binding cassette domain-containing protein [Pseudomonadota bacterium]